MIFFFSVLIYSKTLSENDISLIDSLLAKKNLSTNDLNFEKDWATSTKLKLPIVLKILDEPLYFPVFVDSLKSMLNTKNPDILKFSDIIIRNLSDSTKVCKLKNDNLTYSDIFDYVYTIFSKSFYYQQLAFIGLSNSDKQKLEFLSYDLHKEDKDFPKYKDLYAKKSITQFDSLKSEEIISLISKINFEYLYQGALVFYRGFYELKNFLQHNEIKQKGEWSRKTRYGNFFISTMDKNNIYTKNYAFLLDTKGNDRYFSDFNTDFLHPFFYQIDLSGNDLYQSQNIGGLFSTRFGFGASFDLNGNDTYRGNDYSFSAWCSYMLAMDMNGSDYYQAGLHSLGAATLGISYLFDANGNDIYNASEFAEGFASVLGVGIIADLGGNDVYYCGGKYLHAPLAPNDYRTMSQGYGFGIRPDIGGGVGVLYDKSGNDYYDGGVFSIGGAYWYALGIVIDENGNDFYNSVYYPQGSGIHLAAGFLLDENGEDSYYSKHGPGMGAGHDFSVGFLIDKKGNDTYSVEGGLGLGLTNSVGIFIDGEGDDKYVRKYPKNLGWANKSRSTAGLGIFIDKSGNDEYANDYAKNNSFWQRGYFGFAVDLKGEKTKEKESEKKADDTLVDSLLAIENIFEIASGWGVNNNAKRVDAALDILIKRDKEAAKYIAENKMNTKSGLVYRAIKKFAKKSKEIKKYFPTLLGDSDTLVVKNTIALIGELKDSSYLETFKTFLNENKFVKSVLSALGNIKSDESAELLSRYVNSKNEIYRVIVAKGLFKINSAKAKEILEKMKKDNSFLIKAMFMIKEEKK